MNIFLCFVFLFLFFFLNDTATTDIYTLSLHDALSILHAIRELLGNDSEVRYVRAMESSRSKASDAFEDAVEIARDSDIAILFLGEESILSGEAHSRADINLSGDRSEEHTSELQSP